jgi:hypothetical protein
MPVAVNGPRHDAGNRRRWPASPSVLALATMLAACSSFGPATVRNQQADYASALAEAGKRQTLLNILKLRYGDVPAFVSVSQILAGYSVQGTFSVGTELLSGNSLRLSDDANIGVGGTFTNSPTVTYTPVTGASFARTFLAPLAPADLFGLMLAGVQPELVFGLGLHSIGGFDNERSGPGIHRAAGPGFDLVLRLLLSLQQDGQLTIRLAVRDLQRVAWLKLEGGGNEGTQAAARRLREMLRLPPEQNVFELVYTLDDAKPGQIGIRTRSLVEVLGQLAADIDVPRSDVDEGRTYEALAVADPLARFPGINVRHGFLEPRDAFVSVNYDGDWFWIPNSDLGTKRVFSFVMLLLSLSESSRPGQAPVISIPAG